jgi:hypothetical protein
MHRQPTQESMTAAEAKHGEISPEKLQAVTEAMDRARAADGVGDQGACEQAIADVQRARGR